MFQELTILMFQPLRKITQRAYCLFAEVNLEA